MGRKRSIHAITFAVLAIYLMPNISFVPGPALSALQAEIYPSLDFASVSLLSTITSLMMIPSSLTAGVIIGKQMKYKTAAILSAVCITFGGVLPYFVPVFPVALTARAVVGAGIGITFPLTNMLIQGLFMEGERPGLLGMGAAIQSASGILYQVLSGFLTARGARIPWLLHLVILIPLFLILLYLKEPEPAAGEKGGPTAAMPLRPVLICVLHCLLFMGSYPILLNISLVMEYGRYGSAALGGIISSMWTIGGVLAGLVFSTMQRKIGKFTIPVGCALWAAGCGIFAAAGNVAMLLTGTLLCGSAIQICWPAVMNQYTRSVPPDRLGLASALYTSGMCLGCFLSTYFSAFALKAMGTDNPQATLFPGFLTVLAAGTLWSILEITKPMGEPDSEKNG